MHQWTLPGILISMLLMPFFVMAESKGQNKELKTTSASKVLIVYLSRTKNTEAVAKMIQARVGGELLALELQTPYPENYKAIVSQVDAENEEGFMPALAATPGDLEQYEIIYLGFPTWDMQLPPPMKSFLTQTNLSGKTVAPFNTHGGYGSGSSFETVRELCTGCNVVDGLSVRGGLERDGVYLAIEGERAAVVIGEVNEWLRGVKTLERQE